MSTLTRMRKGFVILFPSLIKPTQTHLCHGRHVTSEIPNGIGPWLAWHVLRTLSLEWKSFSFRLFAITLILFKLQCPSRPFSRIPHLCLLQSTVLVSGQSTVLVSGVAACCSVLQCHLCRLQSTVLVRAPTHLLCGCNFCCLAGFHIRPVLRFKVFPEVPPSRCLNRRPFTTETECAASEAFFLSFFLWWR